MITGKVWRHVCAGMLVGGLMLPLSVGAVNEPINIQVTIENPQPSCSISVLGGSNRKLGEIDRGLKEHQPFSIEADCGGYVKTKIKADAVDGLVSGSGAFISVGMGSGESVDNTAKFPRLRLKANGGYVRFGDNEGFCKASAPGRNICDITPVTRAFKETLAGTGSVSVRFTVDYFL